MDMIMTRSITIDELPIPASLDALEANDFCTANELRNTMRIEAPGPTADPGTPADMQEQQYERKQWYVARQNRKIVAFAISTWSIDPATRVTWLDVAVHPAFRRQGIGTALFDRMEALARDAGRPVVQGGAFHLPTEGARLAFYLADVSKAWKDATPEERNRMARVLFGKVVVENKQAVACVPRPELESFFRSLAVNPVSKLCNGGSDGGRFRDPDCCPLAGGAVDFHG